LSTDIATTLHHELKETFREDYNIILKLVNPLKAELNPICYLLALLGAHHFLHVSRIRINDDSDIHISVHHNIIYENDQQDATV
jgi:hypothetical protein